MAESKIEKLNLYQKIQKCRVELQNSNLKKSGKNKFAGFSYYELADFIPKVNELFDKYKLFSQFTLQSDIATLEVFDTENKIKVNDVEIYDSITFSSPVAEINIKGANAIQSLGGANTYMKRYLYLNLLEIVENDSFDAVSGKDAENNQKKGNSQIPKKEELKIQKTQIEIITKFYNGENMDKLLKANGLNKIEDMSLVKASEIITKLKENVKKEEVKENE